MIKSPKRFRTAWRDGVSEARRAAHASRRAALREIEGDKVYEGQQEFLTVAVRVAREGRLSRFVYVAQKLS